MTSSALAHTTWTPDTVYASDAPEYTRFNQSAWPPRLTRHQLDSMRRNPAFFNWLTPEFCQALLSEQRWAPVNDPTLLTGDARRPVMEGKPCPTCGSSDGGHVSALHRGIDTAIELVIPVRCPCGWVVKLREALAKQMKAHARFADVRLSEIKPHPGLAIDADTQAKIIDEIKAAPDDSYFLVGQPNSGKSHLMTGLFRRALARWCKDSWLRNDPTPAVWRISAAQLLDAHVAWDTRTKGEGSVPMPPVTVNGIHAAAERGYRPRLFLDELDKIAATEYKLQKLIAIIDAIYEAQGQVVATANKDLTTLVAKWGFDEAVTTIRRIGGGPGAHTVEFRNQ
jgi:hypothetical protein